MERNRRNCTTSGSRPRNEFCLVVPAPVPALRTLIRSAVPLLLAARALGAVPSLVQFTSGVTGGRSFHASDPRRLDTALATIARELRYQYQLGYTPGRPIDPAGPAWRSIRVEVTRPGLRVRARDGYLVR